MQTFVRYAFSFVINIFVGVAEELCRLFPVDQEIDMTPILRRSKESARRQRSRPESEKVQDIPHSRPLADRIRPNVHHDNPRKRPHDRIGHSGRGRGSHRYEHKELTN